MIWSRVQPLIQAFLARGYNLLSLAYFNAPGLPETLEEIPLEYFQRAFAWLGNRPDVLPSEYVLIGASKGGELALTLGSRYTDIKTVVAINPSSVVWQGIPKKRLHLGQGDKSSWSYRGLGLPYLPYTVYPADRLDLLTLRLHSIHSRALQNADRTEIAAIPVEKTQGAILLLSGKRDRMWPATQMCEQMIYRLEAHGFSFPYEHRAYDFGHNGLIRDRALWRGVFKYLEMNF